MKKIILNILLLVSVLFFPWWLTVFLATFFLYYFKSFNEIVIFGLIMDIYYGLFSLVFNLWDYKFTLFFLLALVSSFYIKKRLKFYNK